MMTMRARFCLFLLYGCLLLLGTLAGIPTSLSASSSTIVGTDGLRLQTIIDRAAPHEKIILEPGLYQGPVLINKPLILESTGAAIIDGGGKGRVVTIDAPDVIPMSVHAYIGDSNITASGKLDLLATSVATIDASVKAASVACQRLVTV